MKKQLLYGLSLIAGSSLILTACSSEYDFESKYDTRSEVEVAFDETFIETFGEPDPEHNWGFGSNEGTRATGEFASHVGAYPDANMWTSKGFLAPDPLTAGQKARVQYYFQMNQNPGGTTDHGTIDFFMQQVYDGGTDPMSGKSPEKYLAANGYTLIESGEHMDHLTAGPDHTHIFNFNNGTCSTNYNVANNNQTDLNDPSQQHADEIQLMLNTKTSCFGYANSDASYVRDDRWRLVEGSVIDLYCDNNSDFNAWLATKNITDDKVVDKWNRSFIGFDFDMIPEESIFVQDTYMNFWLGQNNQVWNGSEFVNASEYGEVVTYSSEWGDNYAFYPYMPGTTDKVRVLTSENNQYCGTLSTVSDGELWHEGKVNIATIYAQLNDGKFPVNNKDNREWVMIGGCADGYYSDWIVSFMPAEGGVTPPANYSRRVIAEDLATAESTDFDYNDVVFDVVQDGNGNTTITLQAAGGTLPLRLSIAGTSFNKEVHEWFQEANPDKTITTKTMINTYSGQHAAYAKPSETISGTFTADQVVITVTKDDKDHTINFYQGKPAQKLAVGTDYDWCDEREPIMNKGYYSNFLEYVKDQHCFDSAVDANDSYKRWYLEGAKPLDKIKDDEHQGTISL